MFRSRGFITFVVVVLIILAAYFLLFRGDRPLGRIIPREDELPLDLVNVIPAEWTIVPGMAKQCSFDNDDDMEWFVVYRYDTTQVPAPGEAAGTKTNWGPIGAAIFDRQTNVIPEGSGNPSPYRPTLLVPYRLLPDLYGGKGQGYLGEANNTSVKPIFYPPIKPGPDCKVEEVTILGYSDGPLPTRLSIFRWTEDKTSFRAAHFVGNARIATNAPLDSAHPAQTVTTFNRLANHRSLLCESRTHQRSGAAKNLLFTEQDDAYTVDFCFGAPPDPYYPEGAVVALLRNSQPGYRDLPGTATPVSRVKPELSTKDFLLNNTVPPPELAGLRTQAYQIFSVTNPGGVTTDPAGGRECAADEINVAADTVWICGRERAEVQTDIALAGVVRQVVWQLISVVPDQVDSDAHWRVERIDLR